MRRRRLAYISGPVTGYDLEERGQAFAAAADFLTSKGYQPVNPLLNGLPADAPHQHHMRADLQMLLSCDYIYLLHHWWCSKGARVELDVALMSGIKVIYEDQKQKIR